MSLKQPATDTELWRPDVELSEFRRLLKTYFVLSWLRLQRICDCAFVRRV